MGGRADEVEVAGAAEGGGRTKARFATKHQAVHNNYRSSGQLDTGLRCSIATVGKKISETSGLPCVAGTVVRSALRRLLQNEEVVMFAMFHLYPKCGIRVIALATSFHLHCTVFLQSFLCSLYILRTSR